MKAFEIGAFEAKNRLSRLLVMVENGQRVFITRRGKRVALLTRADDELGAGGGDPRGKGGLLARFRALREQGRPGPESMRELVEEGRR